jgi:hypothetical protein
MKELSLTLVIVTVCQKYHFLPIYELRHYLPKFHGFRLLQTYPVINFSLQSMV